MTRPSWPYGWTHDFEKDLVVEKDYIFRKDETRRPPNEVNPSDRFELHAGDVSKQDQECARKDGVARARAERAQPPEQALQDEGSEHWYAWSFFVESGFPESASGKGKAWEQVTLTQFMQRPDVLDEYLPAFMFAKRRDSDFVLRYFPHLGRDGSQAWPIISHHQFVGVWHKLVVHIKWTYKADGFVKVWLNDNSSPVVNKMLATRTKGSGGVYHKYGIYRIDDAGSASTVVYFSRLRHGKTRAEVDE